MKTRLKPNILVIVIAAFVVEMNMINKATDKGVGAFAADKIVINDMSGAVHSASNDSNNVGSDDYILDAKSFDENDYIEEAKTIYIKTKDAAAANAIINRGITNLGSSTDLEYYSELYDSGIVRDIGEFNVISSAYYLEGGPITSSYGDEFESTYRFKAHLPHAKEDDKAYVKYALDGECNTFEAAFLIDPKNPHNSVKFKVYGDGALLYETNYISVDDKPESAVVDVTNVIVLEVIATCKETYSYGVPKAYMAAKAYTVINESDL